MIAQMLEGKGKDLGAGFSVRRTLPQRSCRAVGPFVFWDEMGPATMPSGAGLDVRPHPHIGLATITFLFEGALVHRDSLGVQEHITPGDVNLMIAGSGIVHSERTPAELRAAEHRVHGIQAWLALPQAEEERAPSFHHVPAAELPLVRHRGASLTVIAGTMSGLRSSVPVLSPTLYADLRLEPGASIALDDEHAERAVYVVGGGLDVGGSLVEAGRMAVLETGAGAVLRAASEGAHAMLLGGAPLDGARNLFWNFVSSRRERIDQAKRDWWRAAATGFAEGPFRLPPTETEYIPLEGEPPAGPPECSRESPTT